MNFIAIVQIPVKGILLSAGRRVIKAGVGGEIQPCHLVEEIYLSEEKGQDDQHGFCYEMNP